MAKFWSSWRGMRERRPARSAPTRWFRPCLECLEERAMPSVGAGFAQDATGGFFGGAVVYEDAYALDARQFAHDFGIDPGNRGEPAGPVAAVMRPGDPGSLVRFPFGGHAEP